MVPHLAVVASDSGIVFRGEKGPPLDHISALCAKERFEGALAEARAFTARAEPSTSVHPVPGHRETRDGGAPPVVGGIVAPRDGLPPVWEPRGRPPTRLNPSETRRKWLPATGHSGGILLGVREDAFSVEDMDRGEFFVSMAVTDRRVHLSWEGWGANLGADLRARKGALLGQLKALNDLADGPAEPRGGTSLCEDFWPPADQVSDVENAELTLPFSLEEVGHAIASMKACSAPGPDGLPVIFFQRFWETMRPVIMPMFQEFYIGTLHMGRINFGVIDLIPKVVGAPDIRQFRPITVINVLARIFGKVCATRLSPVAERIAHPLQSTFLKGRRIHDGILALHEIVHEVASKRLKGVFLKLDFQKAYDSLDWSFLRLVMERRGFGDRWCSWIMQLVRSGNTAININGDVGPFFEASRG
ncbi:hypothetical protein D1007_40041 [Hordeum vulgare]|nr:hypothetical protein D1007_40041 [Hordeum vulgare]